MEALYLPIIREHDFECFRKIVDDDVAPTFEEWKHRHAQRIAEYGKTHRIIEVQVNPDEFSTFVNSRPFGTKARLLLDFAEIVGKRNGL